MRGKRKPVYRLLAVVLCICITMTQTSIVSAEDSREAALLNSRESDSGSISVYGAADSMDASGDEPAGDDGTPDDGTKGSQENTGNGTDAGEEAGTGVDPGAGTGVDTGAGTEADKGADTSNDGNTAANDSDTSGDGTEDKADQTENKNEASENLDLYYKDGRICIYNYKQILLIGSGQQVYTGDIEENSDQGDVGDVVRTENDVLTYGLDQKYYLMNDIEMDTSSLWEFPDAFTGTIEPYESREETGVYDEAADTIYIYNRYQLELMLSEDAEKELVMSEDWTAEKVGMGQPLVLEDGSKLTYGTSHKYVLASDFTSATPELLSHKVMTLADDGSYEGRDFAGQVIKKIGDIEYILIGNREQLQAIGSGAVVYTAVYQASQLTLVSQWEVDKDSSGNPIMLYGGDADLAASQNGKKEYTFGKPDKAGSNGLRITGRCGVNQTTGEIDPNLDIEEASGHKYDADENYIIFRDIDLENKDWTPLMFSGTIEGRLNMVEESAVTISNVYVTQSGDLDNSKTSGIGFFGSIMNTSKNTIGISDQAVSVKNMTLRNVSVTNTSTKIKNNTGLISGLLEILGAILGTLLGPFGDAIDSLLNPSKNVDETVFATGAFAGRISGQVTVENCTVDNITNLSNEADITGGFAGNIEGVTEYGQLQAKLDLLVNVLKEVLNVIPFVDLGTLIEVLLGGGVLDVSELIPTGYYSPQIVNCRVTGESLTINNPNNYNGGFAGRQIGAVIKGSSIFVNSLTVNGSNLTGGFSGLTANAELVGLLKSLGVDLVKSIRLNSFILNCSVKAGTITINATNQYAGGLSGSMNNSFAVDSVVEGNVIHVQAKDYAGGITGRASLAQSIALGEEFYSGEKNLISLLSEVISGGLTMDTENSLLALTGISPSVLAGVTVTGELSVEALNSYAGGFVGAGDGVVVISSSELSSQSWVWSQISGSIGYTPGGKEGGISNLKMVKAKDYAGGIIGKATTASAAGILNKTLGIGNYLKFTVNHVAVTGTDDSSIIATGNYAGGAFGLAAGGDISDVNITNIKEVTSQNYAGGFGGSAGTGSLTEAGGLNILGLIKISNLLSIGDGITTKINQCKAGGTYDGMTVLATGKNVDGGVTEFIAGGFIGKSNSTKIESAAVENLKSVTADDLDGYAGGFIGISRTGGLAEVSDATNVSSLIQAGNLISAVGYLIPSYTTCSVTYVDGGGVAADTAGGFVGDFQSGKVNNAANGEGKYYAVYNLDYVKGQSYAGGFGGKVYSGALASVNGGGGLSILGGLTNITINVADLVSLIDAYVPYIQYAGVQSEKGFTVEALKVDSIDRTAGSAGGFIGYGSGVQISYSDVAQLKHTEVAAPANLEDTEGTEYFDEVKSRYAVNGARYAGGYIGKMDVGDAASVGSGLQILGKSIALSDVLSALSVVVSTIEHSDVSGGTGGFSIMANAVEDGSPVGMAGGFAGNISGGHVQDSNVDQFSYIIGQIAAGGYVGEFEPGNVANVLDRGSIFDGLLSAKGSLLSVGEYFVPTIHNSSTACIPCGGAVRAQAAADSTVKRGLAGGYVGHNEGGLIKGLDKSNWKAKPYDGPINTCKAERIVSVYGAEYAGGFSGLMECADTAASSNLSILYGLITADNLLSTLSIVYPFEENTAVCGPLAGLDYDTWSKWIKYVGKNGGRGSELAALYENGTVANQEELDALLSTFIYGYQVAAGRQIYSNQTIEKDGGCAGGYVGAMHSGVITNGQASDVKKVTAMKSCGGYVGEMLSGGAAKLGNVSILGLDIGLDRLLDAAEVFVPTIKVSSVQGYQSGLNVLTEAVGNELANDCGNAGGYVGSMAGGQIWGDDTDNVNPNGSCSVTNLRRVRGTNKIGGYAGYVTSGSVANANTNVSDGILQAVLNSVIKSSSNTASVLQAAVSTIRNANVKAADESWGYVVEGDYKENGGVQYAKSAGGFVGMLEAAVVGDRKGENKVTVSGLRGVSGGLYAGGFFGLADVGSVASVSGNDTESGKTSILLDLIKAGEVSVLDAFRSYVYYADVGGVADGIQIRACMSDSEGTMSETRYTGNAGGFGGGLLNGSVKHCNVSNLSAVNALNYAGGFIGHLGKNGAVDVDNAQVADKLNLLGATAGVLDIFGSHVEDSSVTGIADGFVVKTSAGSSEVAGGFVGYADLSKVDGCKVDNLKKVSSEAIAGGFVGRTNMEYVADAEVNSILVNILLKVINGLLQFLYMDKLENLGVIDLGIPDFLGLQVFSEGNLLGVNLLGLKITAALSKEDPEYNGATDAVIVTIGDSTIKLPCTKENGVTEDGDTVPQLKLTLIKGNRTNITNSMAKGIGRGYDVYGGGATDNSDGAAENGYSGGFVGFNKEGVFEQNQMIYCDVVRGTSGKTGPFTGTTDLKSTYYTNTKDSIEAKGNQYSVYRKVANTLTKVYAANGSLIGTMSTDGSYSKCDVIHRAVIKEYEDWNNAVIAADEAEDEKVTLGVYESPAKAVLMSDAKVSDNSESLTPEPADTQDPCKQTVDITIQKIWKDWGDWDRKRPNRISVTIMQKYTNAEGQTVEQEYDPDGDPATSNQITLTKEEDASGWTSTWKKVISGLPVAIEIGKDENGEPVISYYSYTIKEKEVTDYYLSTIEYDNTGYVVTITNRHDVELPLTGGKGMVPLVILAVLLAMYGIYRHDKKKKCGLMAIEGNQSKEEEGKQ